jgi:tRNAmet cytidine acetate ligase
VAVVLFVVNKTFPLPSKPQIAMKSVGLITEYNPFHNGHLHHLQESRRQADAEVAVAVMSGHFLQRGEPALFDKWLRTETALAAGVDVVVELPFPWACNSAPYFAQGAVQALTALGVEYFCFGSESGDLGALQAAAGLLLANEARITAATAALLRRGLAYPEARAQVVRELAGEDAAAVLETPNNILGLAYLRALHASGSPLHPLTIPRVGAGYHDTEACGSIASATGIRRLLAAGEPVLNYLPAAVQLPFLRAVNRGLHLDEEHLHRLLVARILRGAESLRGLYQVEDGLEQRLFTAALTSGSYAELVDSVKSRHWTRTRVQRILAHLLNESTSDAMDAFLEAGPRYLHLLGTSSRGRRFLASRRKSLTLPLIGNFSRVHPLLKRRYGSASRAYRLAETMLDCELRATRNYTLLLKSWNGENRNRDFFDEPLFRS